MYGCRLVASFVVGKCCSRARDERWKRKDILYEGEGQKEERIRIGVRKLSSVAILKVVLVDDSEAVGRT